MLWFYFAVCLFFIIFASPHLPFERGCVGVKMKETIEHSGIVEKIDGGHVVVKIMQTSACATCKAKSFCASNENKEKRVDVNNCSSSLNIGDEVVVCASASMGWQAIALAFVVPLVVMVAAVVVTLAITDNEPMAALVGIASLVPYYLLLYMFRNKLTRKMTFWIEKS